MSNILASISAELRARDMLKRMGMKGDMNAGNIVELANLIAERDRVVGPVSARQVGWSGAPPLAIVQARMGSTRLPGKMLLPLAGKPLVWHAWNAAVEAFGPENVVCAIPATVENYELAKALAEFPALRWDGPEDDVLARFYYCAHGYRWHPDSVIVRVTPDDTRKDPALLRRVAAGERWDVERGGEAFTLAMLDRAYEREPMTEDNPRREHITHALFPTAPPPPPPGIWTVDTPEDYEAMRKVMES